ncbi:MAG: K+/H+ antiporter subunit F [Paracoccaceae bacterium]
MIACATAFAMICFALAAAMNLWRLVTAPGVPDKVLALDTMVIDVIALIVLYGIATGRGVNFEAAMLFAMTGFVGTVAFCRFLLRGKVIE